jgi:catechol 2,3-dioxygenase
VSDIGAQLSHVALLAHDVPKMERFYGDVLGLRVSDRGISGRLACEMAFMSGTATVHHQLVLIAAQHDGETASRINHMAFTVGSLAALRAVRDRAIASGVATIRQSDHGNAWSVYFSDPEGNEIEVFVPTPFHVPQPHGRPLDLDRSDEAVLAETELACRQSPGFLTRAQWEEQQRANGGAGGAW